MIFVFETAGSRLEIRRGKADVSQLATEWRIRVRDAGGEDTWTWPPIWLADEDLADLRRSLEGWPPETGDECVWKDGRYHPFLVLSPVGEGGAKVRLSYPDGNGRERRHEFLAEREDLRRFARIIRSCPGWWNEA